jgi:glycosyltransferase involved in cell wall biosynthesis
MIITDTEAVRRQVIERFRVHPGRVVSVPLAASEIFRPVDPPQRAPYILFAGTLEPRKNIPALVAAWRAVRREHTIDLVLAGRRRADFPELPPEPGLCLVGEVADAELARLYSGAAAFVYPSLYEGFGLPLLEAMKSGACVIASEDPALREVAAGAALHVPPGELAPSIRLVLENANLRAELRSRGRVRAKEFSWTRTARETRAVYEEACRRWHA